MDNSADNQPPAHPLHNIPIEVSVIVGKARPLVRDLLTLGENAILALNSKIEDPVELYIGERLIARGELQETEGAEPGQLAVRLTEVAVDKGELS
jgi:flagellar motor switch protein FliN/FliY